MFTPLILLVDDFTDAREMYAEYLAFRGYAVVTAASGHEAVALALTERPKLILMDLNMRGMTGTEAMRLLRAEPACQGVPILAFTAHAMAAEQVQAISEGFDAVIAKPCLPDQLVELIQPYLFDVSEASI
jgi:CheY-like chemotaxis protein